MIISIHEEAVQKAAALTIEFPDRNARTGRTGTVGPVLWDNRGNGAA